MSQPSPQRRPPAGTPPASFESYETRRDAEAALAAREELGPEYSEHIAAGLADRVEQLAAVRTAELRHAADNEQRGSSLEKTAQTQRFVLGLVSVVAGIPITAISGSVVEPGLIGLIVAWTGIVGVNVAHALAGRRRN